LCFVDKCTNLAGNKKIMEEKRTLSLSQELLDNGFTEAQVGAFDEIFQNMILDVCNTGGRIEVGTAIYISVMVGPKGRATMTASKKKGLSSKVKYRLIKKKQSGVYENKNNRS